MPMKLTSGLAFAAVSVSVASRNPLVMITFGFVARASSRCSSRSRPRTSSRCSSSRSRSTSLAACHRVVGVLVERAVVDATDVGDEAHVEAVGRLDALRLGLLALLVERDRGARCRCHRRRWCCRSSCLDDARARRRRRHRTRRARAPVRAPRAIAAEPGCLNSPHPSPPSPQRYVLPDSAHPTVRISENGRRFPPMSGHLGRAAANSVATAPRSRRCAPPGRGSPGRSDPPVAAPIAARIRGVTAAPVPCGAARRDRRFDRGVDLGRGIASGSGIGTARSTPRVGVRARRARARRATSPRPRRGAAPAARSSRHQNIGNSSVCQPSTGTPRLSRCSSVRGRSRNAFAPALTVTTGCAAIAPRSELMSPVRSAPRWTPPMPPVANTSMPGRGRERERGRHGRDADRLRARRSRPARSRSATFLPPFRMRSCSAGSRPTRGVPSSTAVIAGTAPPRADRGDAAVERARVGRRGQPERREDRRLERDDRAGARARRATSALDDDMLMPVAHATARRSPRPRRTRAAAACRPRPRRPAARRARARAGTRPRTRRPRRSCRRPRRPTAREPRRTPRRGAAPAAAPCFTTTRRAPGSPCSSRPSASASSALQNTMSGSTSRTSVREALVGEHRRRRVHRHDHAAVAGWRAAHPRARHRRARRRSRSTGTCTTAASSSHAASTASANARPRPDR